MGNKNTNEWHINSTDVGEKKVFNVPNHCAIMMYIARGNWLPSVREGRDRDI